MKDIVMDTLKKNKKPEQNNVNRNARATEKGESEVIKTVKYMPLDCSLGITKRFKPELLEE